MRIPNTMHRELQHEHNSNKSCRILLLIIILIQLMGAVYLCNNTRAGGDGIFTFTLANTPYEFNYLANKIERFPSSNGWMNAGILKEQYMAMPYDRFNYSSVYWHQRIDNHPLLYYSAVHTICSLFPETYSIWYALIINLIALLFVDYILIRVAKFVLPANSGAPVVIIVAATSIVAFYQLTALARMYMLLALMGVWFLWICLRLVYRSNVSLWEIYFCVLLGSQTHYYYYVFSALSGFITLLILCKDREWKRIWHILLTAGMAFCSSLIIFPWVVWHIVFNQMDKNETLRVWDLETLRGWLTFVNETVLNNHGIRWIIIAAILVVLVMRNRKMMQDTTGDSGSATSSVTAGTISISRGPVGLHRFWILTGCSTLVFSMVIYTLNGPSDYYATPVYLPSAIMMTVFVMTAWNQLTSGYDIKNRTIAESGICLSVMLLLLGGISSNVIHDITAHEEYQRYLAFHQVAVDYPGVDCLYVSNIDDNLLQSMWFEFGEYDEIRKLPIEEYNSIVEAAGASAMDTILSGRETQDMVVLYMPDSLELPEGTETIAELNGFRVAVLNE